MIRVNKILGNIHTQALENYQSDIIEIAWYDTRKKIARLMTQAGRDIAMKLESAPKEGISDGDIIYQENGLVIFFKILATKVLYLYAKDVVEVAKINFELGNRHAPLFFGDSEFEFQTPYELPLQKLAEKLMVKYEIKESILDSKKRLNVSMPHSEPNTKIVLSNTFSVNIIKEK